MSKGHVCEETTTMFVRGQQQYLLSQQPWLWDDNSQVWGCQQPCCGMTTMAIGGDNNHGSGGDNNHGDRVPTAMFMG